MAYCSKCGAYIPDGMTRCLACGYDEHAEQTAAQYAYKYDEAEAKKDYEAERARKQEQNKQWAREEYARRVQQQGEDKARLAREAEEDRERQRAEAEARAAASYDPGKKSEAGLSYSQGNSRFFAALSYIPFLFILQKMFLPDDAFAEFHGRQGRKLTFVWMLAQIIGGVLPIPGLGLVAFLLGCGFAARGIANAKAGKMAELPFINKLFNRLRK